MDGNSTITLGFICTLVGALWILYQWRKSEHEKIKSEAEANFKMKESVNKSREDFLKAYSKDHEDMQVYLAKEFQKLNMKQDNTCQNLTEIRIDMRNQKEVIDDVIKRIIILERDQKTLFNRYDELKEKD